MFPEDAMYQTPDIHGFKKKSFLFDNLGPGEERSHKRQQFHYQISNWIQFSKYLIMILKESVRSLHCAASDTSLLHFTWALVQIYGETIPVNHDDSLVNQQGLSLSQLNYLESQWNWEHLISQILHITTETA